MTADLHMEQAREWDALYEEIQAVLRSFGKEDGAELQGESYVYVSRDYLLVSDNWGGYRHRIETSNPEFIRPAVIASLRKLLIRYPNWEIVLALGGSEKEKRPSMGLVIRDDEVIDALEREYLPKQFQSIEYEGSRPLGSRFGDIMYS